MIVKNEMKRKSLVIQKTCQVVMYKILNQIQQKRCALQLQLLHLVLSNDSRSSHHLRHYKNLQPGYNPRIKLISKLKHERINKYDNKRGQLRF